jgi:type IV secretion system pilin
LNIKEKIKKLEEMSNILKSTKYLILITIVLFVGFGFSPTQIVLADGGACGTSGEGICKMSCNPFDDIVYTSNCSAPEQCCVRTYCESTNIGIGTCEKNTNSCGDSSVIGTYTSDCAPPNLCCVSSGQGPGFEVGHEFFTGEVSNEFVDETGGNGLVPCTGFDCSMCSLFELIKNIINFLTKVIFALATAFIVWGAIEIMTAGGSETRITSGRERITTAIFGIAITLGAWLLIGTILQVLTGSSSKLPWNEIECSSEPISFKPILKADGDNLACINKGGTCQSTDAGCEGAFEPGLCLAPGFKDKAYMQCCVPAKPSDKSSVETPSIEMTNCNTMPGYSCSKSECSFNEMKSKVCPSNEYCCPK